LFERKLLDELEQFLGCVEQFNEKRSKVKEKAKVWTFAIALLA